MTRLMSHLVKHAATEQPADIANAVGAEAETKKAPIDAQVKTDLHVVTTVALMTNIVSNITGARLTVTGLVPEGTNSQTVEPRPQMVNFWPKPI